MDHKQPTNKDRPDVVDRSNPDRQAREPRSGEGADSALANLKSIERDRRQPQPRDDGASDK